MSGSTSRIRTMFQKNCRIRTMFRMMSCGQEGSDKVTRKGGKHGRGGEAHQPLSQLKPSRRRLRAPSTPPVIDSWSVIAVTCDESESSAAFIDGSFQPLAVESMARWTSTRPIVLGEEAVPWDIRTASATGAAPAIASATGAAPAIASRVPQSFEYGVR